MRHEKKHNRVYHALCCMGHAPEKAASIIVDAKRPSTKEHAMQWIRLVHHQVPTEQWIERHKAARLREVAA